MRLSSICTQVTAPRAAHACLALAVLLGTPAGIASPRPDAGEGSGASQPSSQPSGDRAGTRAGPAPERPAEPRVLLRQAIDLYVLGRYAEAAARLRPLVETRVLHDRADQKEALRAYGISLFLSGGRAGAERAFRELLRLDPGERLDPGFVRPEVVSFFESVRSALQAELAAEVRRRGPRGHAVVNLLPPWGQFQNGHRTKGYVLLGGELLLGATSIVSAALLYSWQDDTGQFHDREDLYTPMSAVNYASFAALAALLLYGVIDGLYYYYQVPPAPDPARPPAGRSDPGRVRLLGPVLAF